MKLTRFGFFLASLLLCAYLTSSVGPDAGGRAYAQNFGHSVVNGIEVYRDSSPRSRIFGNRDFLTSASLCAQWAQGRGRLEQALLAASAQVNSRLPSGVSIVRQSAALSQNCTAVANYAAGTININAKLPSNVFTFNVTTPGPLPQSWDPRVSIHFDAGLSAQITIPTTPRNGLSISPVQVTISNIEPRGENLTGDIALAAAKFAGEITGQDFLGQLTRDRTFQFDQVNRLLAPINGELAAQFPALEHTYDPTTKIVILRGPTKEASFRSSNNPDRYIRHRNSLGYLEPVPFGDSLGEKDASFRIVPGLARSCASFESNNFPDHFLRHQGSRLKLARRTADPLFAQDATFCMVAGLSGPGTSFESVNYPGHYIRHRNFELWLDRFNDSDLFKKDATFEIVPVLVFRGSGVR